MAPIYKGEREREREKKTKKGKGGERESRKDTEQDLEEGYIEREDR